jgi:hypothetical protein
MAKNGTMSAPGHYADELLRQRRALADFGTLALQEVDFDKLLAEAARLCAEGLKVPYCKVLEYRGQASLYSKTRRFLRQPERHRTAHP